MPLMGEGDGMGGAPSSWEEDCREEGSHGRQQNFARVLKTDRRGWGFGSGIQEPIKGGWRTWCRPAPLVPGGHCWKWRHQVRTPMPGRRAGRRGVSRTHPQGLVSTCPFGILAWAAVSCS